MAEETTQSVLDKDTERLTQLQTQLAEAAADVDRHASSLEPLSKADGTPTKGLEDPHALIDGMRTEAADKAKGIETSISSLQAKLRTNQFVEPLISAFGSVEVPSSSAVMTSISLVDLESKTNKARTTLGAAQSNVNALEALAEAVETAGIPEDAIGDIRQIHFEADGEKKVKARIASGRGGGGGGRAAAGLKRIVGSNQDKFHDNGGVGEAADHVGKSYGTGGDFKSARAFVEATVNASKWTDLDGNTSTGNKKSWSAHQFAQRMGFETENVEVAEEAAD